MADTNVAERTSQAHPGPGPGPGTSTELASMRKEMGKRGTITDGKPTLFATHGRESLEGECAFAVVTKDSTGAGLMRGLKRGPYDRPASQITDTCWLTFLIYTEMEQSKRSIFEITL